MCVCVCGQIIYIGEPLKYHRIHEMHVYGDENNGVLKFVKRAIVDDEFVCIIYTVYSI